MFNAAAQRNSDNTAGKRHEQSMILLIQLQTQHPALTATPVTHTEMKGTASINCQVDDITSAALVWSKVHMTVGSRLKVIV